MCTAQCTVYTVQFTLYTVHYKPARPGDKDGVGPDVADRHKITVEIIQGTKYRLKSITILYAAREKRWL